MSGTFNPNLFGTKVTIQGAVTNNATVANYKDVEVKIIFYSETGTTDFMLKVNKPDTCKTIGIDVIRLTVFLRQKGSSESKRIGGKEEVDRQPKKHPGAPWAVRKGGVALLIYKHSLSMSLMVLFMISFLLHWYGSNKDYNQEQILNGESTEGMWKYE